MKSGGKLESLIRKTADHLARNQVARLYQWPVPTMQGSVLGKCPTCHSAGSFPSLVYLARTGADFFGYTRFGRFVMIEAKECAKPRLPVNVESGHGLKRHQACALREVYRAGGIGLVVWMCLKGVYVIPIDRIAHDLKSIALSETYRRTVDPETGIDGLLL
jgi:hypothetical protein